MYGGKGWSEKEVITLYDALVTPGVHEFCIENVDDERILLEPFTRCLYHNVAYLTTVPAALPPYIDHVLPNLLDLLAMGDHYARIMRILDCLFYDLIVVEFTEQLRKEDVFGFFMQIIYEYNLVKTIPILIFKEECL